MHLLLFDKCLFSLSDVFSNAFLSLFAVIFFFTQHLFSKHALHSASILGQFSEASLSFTVSLVKLSTVLLGKLNILKLVLLDLLHLFLLDSLRLMEQGLHSEEVVALPLGFLLHQIFSLLVYAFHIFDFFKLLVLILLFLLFLLLQSMLTTLNVELVNFILVGLLSLGLLFSS